MRPETIRTKISTLAVLFLAGIFALGLSACGGSSSSGTAIVTAVMITPTAATVDFNTPIDITAQVTLSNNTSTTNTSVTFQVNGIGGGNDTVGTIVNSPDDNQVGIYTAPHVVPPENNGQVMITATAPQNPSNTTDTNVVTSNTAIITVGAGLGLTVSPTSANVGAGGTKQFSALLNNVADPNATWSVSSTATCDNCIGSINRTTGLYTAPPSPPPGDTVTVTATDATVSPTQTATATVTIAFSDQSLNGPFAFYYSGSDQSGFMAAAGSFFADGLGHIQSGIEDVDSFSNGGRVQYQISGTYTVGTDGRTLLKLNQNLPGAATWEFALTSNQHAVMIRFERSITGSGTIDQQNLNDISSLPTITGPYVFSVFGADTSFFPMGIAGKFSTNGSAVQTANAVVDLNDNGVVSQADPLTSGSYSLDSTEPDTGRGTITLTSAMTGTHQYAFYIVDATHLYLVEVDNNDYLAGNMYSGSATPGTLAAANYVFTAGGNSTSGSYASGGVFTSAGNSNASGGSISGGAFDSNNAGTVTPDTTLGACAFTSNATGRIVLGLNVAGGTCPGAGNVQFALYQTAQAASTTVEPSAVMLELDSTAVASGSAYLQNSTTEPAAGSFALNLAGQGIFHNQPSSVQQDVEGQVTLSASSVSSGNLDINDFDAGIQTDAVSATDSSITAPTNGRGTAVLVATNPDVSYNLVYYVIDANTALLFDSDTNRVLIGTIARQF
ncbi:MAG: hypothetical protein ABSB66_01090 [Candidatus Acidiferrales bacterium]|jgi:hypothetical protein